MFIESPKTAGKVKTAFCKKWLEKAEQIIIFYSQSYYDSFWDRNDSLQIWEVLDSKSYSFVKSRNIKTALSEIGYIESINFDEHCEKSILWFYGTL